MDWDQLVQQFLTESGWHGTAQELIEAVKGPFNEDVCRWAYGLGNSARVQQQGNPDIRAERSRVENELNKRWTEMASQYGLSEQDKAKISRYLNECYLAGYAGEPLEQDDGDSSWLWWVLGVAGLGFAGYYLTRK